jgi:hypothetical protein
MNYAIKAKSTLDKLLVDRDNEFTAKILKLVVDNQWDVDDPSFVIALATGQLQVLLEDMPKSLESTSEQALQKYSQKLYEMQEWSALQKVAIDAANKNVVAAGDYVVSKVKSCTNEVVDQVKSNTQDMKNIQIEIDKQNDAIKDLIGQLQVNQIAAVNGTQTEAKDIQKNNIALINSQRKVLGELKSTALMANFISSIPPLITAAVIAASIGLGFFGAQCIYKDYSDSWINFSRKYSKLSVKKKQTVINIVNGKTK